jgi:hypothetical protein
VGTERIVVAAAVEAGLTHKTAMLCAVMHKAAGGAGNLQQGRTARMTSAAGAAAAVVMAGLNAPAKRACRVCPWVLRAGVPVKLGLRGLTVVLREMMVSIFQQGQGLPLSVV